LAARPPSAFGGTPGVAPQANAFAQDIQDLARQRSALW
jgi:hypothetical protein